MRFSQNTLDARQTPPLGKSAMGASQSSVERLKAFISRNNNGSGILNFPRAVDSNGIVSKTNAVDSAPLKSHALEVDNYTVETLQSKELELKSSI